jgi:hypothetical protein
MNWTKTLLCSAAFSVAFFMYFAFFVVDHLSIWAIHEAAPALQTLRAEYGSSYSHAAGHLVAFVAGAAATAAFIFPIRYALQNVTKLAAAALIITLPVALVSAQGADFSPAGVSTVLQPIVGAALVVIQLALSKAKRTQA